MGYNPQESLENTTNTMGTRTLGVHPIVEVSVGVMEIDISGRLVNALRIWSESGCTLSPIIMVQWKMANYLKGNYYWRYTHFSLNHDYGRKCKRLRCKSLPPR